MNVRIKVSRRPKHSQGTRHGRCRRPVAVTRTRTPPPARGCGQHTRHTCQWSKEKEAKRERKEWEKGGGGRSLPPPLPVNEGDEREKGWGQCTRHGRCQNRGHNRLVVVVLSVSHTHAPPPTRGHGQHTRHTCHTGQWASIPHRRDAASTCGASWNGTTRVNGYTKNGEYPGGRRWGWNWTTGRPDFL
jgi:hypothetical protein